MHKTEILRTELYRLDLQKEAMLYLQAVPEEAKRKEFEESFNKVYRWGGFESPFTNLDFCESDLIHTIGMLELSQKIAHEHPQATAHFNSFAVNAKILVHDVGEILAGDLPPFGDERESKKARIIKRGESMWAHQYLFSCIEDPNIREFVKGLYNRYTKANPNDWEALFVKLVDKLQGNWVGCDHVFNFSKKDNSQISPQVKLHIYRSLENTFQAAKKQYLAPHLEIRKMVQSLMEENFGRFSEAGFAVEVGDMSSQWEKYIGTNLS